MARIGYLLDTNIVIDFLGNRLTKTAREFLNPIIDDVPNLSVITKMELLGFKTTTRHYAILLNFAEDSKIHPLTESVVESTIEIRRQKKIKLPDAIIAATAIENKLRLLTRNISDFKNIKDLNVLNPFSL